MNYCNIFYFRVILHNKSMGRETERLCTEKLFFAGGFYTLVCKNDITIVNNIAQFIITSCLYMMRCPIVSNIALLKSHNKNRF